MEDEDFTDRMVELLYAELPASDEEAMRAHLARSEAAREAFARVEEGQRLAEQLPLSEVPAGLLDGVMAAAREAAAERAPAPVSEPAVQSAAERAAPAQAEPADEDTGAWGGFLQWIGGFAARPQFAMAMMLLLMIGIGMWYLPDFRGTDPAGSQAIIDPAPGDEVGPSASLQPAEPLALETDPRTGRIRPRAEEEADPPTTPRRPSTPEAGSETDAVPVDAVAVRDPEGVGSTPEEALRDEAEAETDDDVGAGEVLTEPLADPRALALQTDLAPGQALAAQGERAPALAPSPPPSAVASAQQADRGAADLDSVGIESAPMPAMADGQGSASATYARGMERYRAREYRAAAEDFASVVQRPGADAARLLPSAMHHQARSERAVGSCGAAVRTYEGLLARYPAYSGRPEAMIEAADCYRRLGQLSAARRHLERASQVPSVASRAQQELTRLAMAERAADRQPASATSVAAEPAEAATEQ